MEVKGVKVLCYVDVTDNTKGILCAFEEDKELRTNEMCDKVNEVLKEMLGDFHEPMEVYEVARQICYLNKSTYQDYEFFFEETQLLK